MSEEPTEDGKSLHGCAVEEEMHSKPVQTQVPRLYHQGLV